MATRIRNGQTILFIGDSITDCDRRGDAAPLGTGYVKLFADMLTVREPSKRVTVLNKGIGGNIVPDLQGRWTDDVLANSPDWLSIKIGINDLLGVAREVDGAITPERYAQGYEDILSRTRAALPNCQILLIDPFYISTDRAKGSLRSRILDILPAYTAIVHRMSKQYGTRLVNTHAMFQKLLKHHEPDTFCPEPVHPNATGHLAIAEAVWAALSG